MNTWVLAVPGVLLAGPRAMAATGTTIQVPADRPVTPANPGQSLVNAPQPAQAGEMDQCSGLYGTTGGADASIAGPYTIVLDRSYTHVLTEADKFSDGPDGLPATRPARARVGPGDHSRALAS